MAHILYFNYMMKLCKYFKSMGKYKFLKACAFCYTQKKNNNDYKLQQIHMCYTL